MLKPISLLILCISILRVNAQDVIHYDHFQLEEGELFWQNNYSYAGSSDSLQHDIRVMLTSRPFANHSQATKTGYRGEISRYKVRPDQYGRTGINTPRIYREGEWKGKFILEVFETSYRVTVYELSVSLKKSAFEYHRTRTPESSLYVDRVTEKGRKSFQAGEFINLALMSRSLMDSFDLKSGTTQSDK